MKTILALLILYATSCAAAEFLPFFPTDPLIVQVEEVKRELHDLPELDHENPHVWRVERSYWLKFAEGQIRTARTVKDFGTQAAAEQYFSTALPYLQENDRLFLHEHKIVKGKVVRHRLEREGKLVVELDDFFELSLPEAIHGKIASVHQRKYEIQLNNAHPQRPPHLTFASLFLTYHLTLETGQNILISYEIRSSSPSLEIYLAYYQANPFFKSGDTLHLGLFGYHLNGFCSAHLPAQNKPITIPPDVRPPMCYIRAKVLP